MVGGPALTVASGASALTSGAWDALGTAHSPGRTVGTNSLAAGIGGWDASAWGLAEPSTAATAVAAGVLPQLNFDVDQLICVGMRIGLLAISASLSSRCEDHVTRVDVTTDHVTASMQIHDQITFSTA